MTDAQTAGATVRQPHGVMRKVLPKLAVAVLILAAGFFAYLHFEEGPEHVALSSFTNASISDHPIKAETATIHEASAAPPSALPTRLLFSPRPSAQEITAALDSTIIERLSFRGAVAEDALSFVLARLFHDHPELGQVHIVQSHRDATSGQLVGSNPLANRSVTMDLRNIPVRHALRYVSGASGMKYTIRKGAIYFYSGALPTFTMRERVDVFSEAIYWRVRDLGETAQCPLCGKDLWSSRTRECQHCLMDWSSPDHLERRMP
ncbi:MAG TPA: hypothetical protein VF593_05750 [Chthoniobacteraceae bacterium]|jgi:hypothetical protein